MNTKKSLPNPSFLQRLSMFQQKATTGNEIPKFEKKKYVIDKTKMNKRIENAQKDLEQQTLKRRNTVSILPEKYNTNNLERMSLKIADIQKAKKKKQEDIMKEIHQKKIVDNSGIKKRTEQMKEDHKNDEMNKINKVKKIYQDNIDSVNYDIQSKVESITKTISNRNYDTNKALENIKKNAKLEAQINNNLNKIFGNDLAKKNLSFEQKYHLFDRKINNYEDKEKIKLMVTIKNPQPEYEYESKIYSEDKNLIAQSGKKKGEKEIILYNNLLVDYVFSKKTSYSYEIIKTLLDKQEIKAELNIPLNKVISTKENKNYEAPIESFNNNEVINIGFDSNENKDDDKEKDIQLFFETKNQDDSLNVISYSIQKNNKIIYKSPFCNCSHIKQTDKIPLSVLSPEFEISFYNKDYEEQKMTISTEELLNQKIKNVIIDLPYLEKLDVNIGIQKFEKISLIKLKKDGLNIDLSIAIDFTGSNGYPKYSDSLHYTENGFVNNYEKSIRACCDILSVYNKNDEYEVYGFGADVNGIFSNCFNINGNENSKIKGVENIIKKYKETAKSVYFSGGTYFAPVIKSINDKISSDNKKMNYNVLMIISDGYVDDISDIIDSIIESSKIPLSIVIIGVGSDVTSDMKRLNGEDGKLVNRKGESLEKDIVQYVHFNDYNENIEKLTQEVFRYIPQQIKDYFSQNENNN